MIYVNSRQVKEGEVNPVGLGRWYYTPNIHSPSDPYEFEWKDDSSDRRSLQRGLVYLRKGDAIDRALAMLATDGWNLNDAKSQPVGDDVLVEAVAVDGTRYFGEARGLCWNEVDPILDDVLVAWRCA